MKLDSANRSFYELLTVAGTPFILVGLLGCGVLTTTVFRAMTVGPAAFVSGPAGMAVLAFVAIAALIVLLAVRSAILQFRATARLNAHLGRHRVASTSRVKDLATAAGLHDVRLVDDTAAYSLTHGLWFPRVSVTTALVHRSSDEELAAVLAHERYHTTNRDPLKITLARTVTAAFFFLPAAKDLLDRYLTGRELNADRRARDRCGRRAIAGALLRAVDQPTDLPLSAAAALGGDALETRILQLETGVEPSFPPMSRSAVALTVVGVLAMFGGLLATALAVGTPTVLGSARQADGMDVLGGLGCVAMWLIVALALRKRAGVSQTG